MTSMLRRSDGSATSRNSVVILCALVVALVATVVLLVAQQGRGAAQGGGNADDKTAAIVERVGEIMLLPDETPSTTTIENPDKLQENTFFRNVRRGDEVLIFAQNATLIVYRPSTHQIVNVGPIATPSEGADTDNGADTNDG